MFDELNWLELAGYLGLFVLAVWLVVNGPFHRLAERHQWLVIALLSVGFPVVIYMLRGFDEPALLTKCASLLRP